MWNNLTSVWPDIDETKMFPEAKQLKEIGFDDVGIVEHMLKTYLRWSFVDSASADPPETYLAYAGTPIELHQDGQGPFYRMPISISAQGVWPLLTNRFTVSEKICCMLNLADSIIHELAVSDQFTLCFSLLESTHRTLNLYVAFCHNGPVYYDA